MPAYFKSVITHFKWALGDVQTPLTFLRTFLSPAPLDISFPPALLSLQVQYPLPHHFQSMAMISVLPRKCKYKNGFSHTPAPTSAYPPACTRTCLAAVLLVLLSACSRPARAPPAMQPIPPPSHIVKSIFSNPVSNFFCFYKSIPCPMISHDHYLCF